MFLATAAEKKEEANAAPKAAPEKKPPAKAPPKPLPQMMEEDVIPSLKAIFEAQEDLSDIELVFQDNKVSNAAMLPMPIKSYSKCLFISLFTPYKALHY